MARQQGKMAESMRRSLNEEAVRIQDRFAKAEAIFGDAQPSNIQEKSDIHLAPPASKVIRDTFSLPPADYALLEQLRNRALSVGLAINKSELVRAGLRLLSELNEADFRHLIQRVDKVKPGRPKY